MVISVQEGEDGDDDEDVMRRNAQDAAARVEEVERERYSSMSCGRRKKGKARGNRWEIYLYLILPSTRRALSLTIIKQSGKTTLCSFRF